MILTVLLYNYVCFLCVTCVNKDRHCALQDEEGLEHSGLIFGLAICQFYEN